MITRRPPPTARPEPLTPDERAWAERLARIGPHDGPSMALDNRILAAARAAAVQRPHGHSWRRRWPSLVGAAASLVIVIGLAWQLQPLLRSRPSLGEAPPTAPFPRSEGSLSADVLAAANPVAKTSVANPPPPPSPMVAPAVRRPQTAPPRRPAATAVTAAPSAPQPEAEFGDDAIPPYADYAGVAAARQAATQGATNDAKARAATDKRRERAAVASPQPFPAASTDADGEARPAPTSTRAYAPARDASSRESTASSPQAAPDPAGNDNTLHRVEVTGSRLTFAKLPPRDDAHLAPEAWLQRIRDRRDADDLDGARESLALFRDIHPRIRLPDDLARLAR